MEFCYPDGTWTVFLRVLGSLTALAATLAFFGFGFLELTWLMPQATRGMVIFAQHQKDLFIDEGLINEAYHAGAPSGLAQHLRNETVIVAARSTQYSAYMGAGVIVRTHNGLAEILTAKHIVRHSGRKIVIFPDHTVVPVTRIITSKAHDLAVVFAALPLLETFPVARVSNRPLKNGEHFIVMGHPGSKSWKASPGVAEARLQTTLLFCPTCERGDSGAGAFDGHGELHGVIVAKELIAAPSAQTGQYVQLTAFEVEAPDAIREFLRGVQ